MSKYIYYVYETSIESEFEILNLPVQKEEREVSIKVKLVHEASRRIPPNEFGVFFSQMNCALGAKWGTMEVSDGSLIEIYVGEGFSTHDAAPFIIGWGFAFLFQQRGFTIFHGSALEINNKGVIISGVSGAGKSSLALSLIDSGAKYLVDDLAVMNLEESFDIIPSYPVQKVCRDVSVDLTDEDLLHISEGRDKFAYHNEDGYCNVRIKANYLILLNICDGDDVIVKEHKGLDKWMKILECLYLNEFFVTFGLPEKDKKNCLKLAGTIRVMEIIRPRNKDTLSEITEIVSKLVKE